MLSSWVLVMAMGSLGEAASSADGFPFKGSDFARSARLLAQADLPNTTVRVAELSRRIENLKESRRGKGLMIAGLIVAPVVILPTGLVLFFLGLAADALVPGAGIGTIIFGSVLLAVTVGVVVLCIIGLVSVSNHNSGIEEQIRAAETEREQLLRQPGPRPVSQQWLPLNQVTIARF